MRMGWFRPVHCKSASASDIRAIDDLNGPTSDGFQRIAQFDAGISAVCKDMASQWVAHGASFQQIWCAITILRVGLKKHGHV